MILTRSAAVALVCLSAGLVWAGAPPLTLLAWAPGYPGSTEQAQPTMDDFAATFARAAGWKPERVKGVYHPTAEGGLAELDGLGTGDTLAVVTLPVYLTYRERLDLRPLLQVLPESGAQETWTLVAKRGVIGDAAALSGWQVQGMAGFAPRFVREVALDDWQQLPADVTIEFSPRVLSSLRKAARGETIAVLLDQAQADALDSLPFADDLEVVTRSAPMVGSLLCSVGELSSAGVTDQVVKTLLGLHEGAEGKELLATIRLQRFQQLDADDLATVVKLHDAAAAKDP